MKITNEKAPMSRKVTGKIASIKATMKKLGINSDGLGEQIRNLAKIRCRIEEVEAFMDRDDYSVVQTISTQFGDKQDVHPLEKLYKSYLSQEQSALKALGLNRDSKPVREVEEEDDKFSEFMGRLNDVQ